MRNIQKNDCVKRFRVTLDHLTSIGVYPNTKLDDKQLTGPFISSVILAHIDFDNDINADKQFESGLITTSISFDLDPNTFKQLFDIIERLTIKQDLNAIDINILTILFKLLTTHLKFLCAIKQDLITFITDDDLQKWFDLLSKLIFNTDKKFEFSEDAFMYLINQKFSSFIDRLSFYYKSITENKSPILVKQSFIELNKNLTIFNWIELLCNNNQLAFTILYSFIDMVLINEEYITQILKSFRQILLTRLVPDVRIKKILNGPNDEIDIEPIPPLSIVAVVTKLMSYILSKVPIKKDLFNSILVDLYLMTDTDKLFHFSVIQPIFINILPLLAEYILNTDEMIHELYWLVGKMINILIIGSPEDLLEKKFNDKLRLSLFAGGCEKNIIEKNESITNLLESNLATYTQFKWTNQNEQSSSDNEFLMSIYNNTDRGAQLILKLKMHIKTKQYFLQQADDACAAIFAVYIKFFRRINLAKYELNRTNNKNPHKKLLTIFEYANYVYNLFATTKGQGGDCNQLYKQIKINTLFLLSSIKESHLIPIIETDMIGSEINRESFRLKKNKQSFRLIRNIFKASNRLKKTMLANKQKQDNEYLLHKTINDFIYQEFQSEDIIQCIIRQYQRALTRLISYRFILRLIDKVLHTKNQQHLLGLLSICLPYLRGTNIEWTYLENIQTANDDLKEELGNIYYSIIKTVLPLRLESTLVFHLLNFSYEQNDIHRLYDNQFVESSYSKDLLVL